MSELCAPYRQRCPHCGETHTYRCGRTLLLRDPTNRAEACPGGIMVCGACMEVFETFMAAVYDARAVRKEHEES